MAAILLVPVRIPPCPDQAIVSMLATDSQRDKAMVENSGGVLVIYTCMTQLMEGGLGSLKETWEQKSAFLRPTARALN